MSHEESSLERVERRHDRLQLLMLMGIGLGTLGLVAEQILEMAQIRGVPMLVVNVVTLIGWIVFASTLIYLSRFTSEKSDLLTSVVDDERVEALRGRAFTYGFSAVFITQVVLLVGDIVAGRVWDSEVSVRFGVHLTIAVGVIASLGRFLYLNWDGER